MRLSPMVLMLSTLATALTAQSSSLVEIGSRVRMRPDAADSRSPWIVGTVSARLGETVRVRPIACGAEQVFRFDGPAALFVSRGKKASPAQGAIIGAVGGVIGAVVGGVIGAVTKHEAWGPVDRRSLRPIVSTAHGRLGLGLSARF